MKKNILFFLLYTIMCFTSYSQNKQISYSSVNGLVTYDNGSGTKADIGAKLYIIPCKYFKQDIELKNDSIQMGYESLLQYIKWKELVGQEQAIAKLKEYDFYISAEEQIRREGELAICLVDILKSNKVKYSCTIDNMVQLFRFARIPPRRFIQIFLIYTCYTAKCYQQCILQQ